MNNRIRKKHIKRKVLHALQRHGMSMKDLQDDTCEVARWVKREMGAGVFADIKVTLLVDGVRINSCMVDL